MAYINQGKVVCKKCNTTYFETQMMDMDNEGEKSLIYCEECKTWTQWKTNN